MEGMETVRDTVNEQANDIPPSDYFERRLEEGWKLVALEWQRPAPQARETMLKKTEVPYGLRVAADCCSLEEHPVEVEALTLMLEMLVDDFPFGAVAEALNEKGLRDRNGTPWNQVSVFQLVPRLVEVGSDVFSSHDWWSRRNARKTASAV